MSKKFSKAFLMSGSDYRLTNSITLHHPSVGEILSVNNSSNPDYVYWTYVQILLSDPYSNMVMLDDMGKNYLEVSPYDVFILQWDTCAENYKENKALYDTYNVNPSDDIKKALQFFIKESCIFEKGSYQDGSICFYDV